MKTNELVNAVGEKSDYTTAAVRKMLKALREVVTTALKKSGRAEIPGVVILKVARTKARKAGTRVIFGKSVKVKAKPAGTKVKARVKKSLREAVEHKK